MNTLKKRKYIRLILTFSMILTFSGRLETPAVFAASDLPVNLEMSNVFEPGLGEPVGEVQLVQGDAVIIHADRPAVGYRALKGMPLYKGDIIATRENGKASLFLNDKTVMTLTKSTRLVINDSIYSPDNGKERTSFISQTGGKVRFLVQKLLGFTRSEFKVKTQTAIVGVRGSDFVVEAGKGKTKVSVFEDTELEMTGLLSPCEDYRTVQDKKDQIAECEIQVAVLSDFQQAELDADGTLEMLAEQLLPEQIELMKQEFQISPNEESFVKRRRDEPEIERNIYVSRDSLIPPELWPEETGTRIEIEELTLEEGAASFADTLLSSVTEQLTESVFETIGEEKVEETEEVLEVLPDFPDVADAAE